jgi:predicted DNA-binding transcriptional regulator YafY
MGSSASTASRLLALLSLLQVRREWSGSLLAERLDVSRRTVRRDVDRLRAMGYQIHADRGTSGGYRLDPGSELPPLLLDDEQVTAIAVALQVAPLAGAGLDEAASRALATIGQVMPPRLRQRLEAVQVTTLDGTGRPPVPVATDVLVLLSTAVRAREVVRFDYVGPGESPSEGPPRRVEPHHLVATHGRWYLVAWDRSAEDWRTFRVDRMAPREHTGPRFVRRTVPGGDVHDFVAARFKGGRTNAWPCRGKVVLDLPAKAVVPFVDDGIVEDLGADGCSLEIGSWSWTALAGLLGRFDADVRVVYPQELRTACGQLARRYARAAGAPSSSG